MRTNEKKNSTENLVEKETNRQDIGFGTKVTDTSSRLISKEGHFNVKRKNQSFAAWLNLYHRLITISWASLAVVIFASYFIVNLFFAYIYFSIGIEYLNGATTNEIPAFWNAFFFSSQTLTTVGYGHISPNGMLASSVAAFEALLGLMMFAIITGLLYGRFSRPNPRIIFSETALIGPYFGINALMIRMINEKSNQLINVNVNVILSRNEQTENGITRKYYTLSLERSMVRFFPMNWTVVHPITEDSPFKGETIESLKETDAEIMISLEATNDTYADPIYVRHSYLYNEIVWGAKFTQIIDSKNGSYLIDLGKISDYEPHSLN